MYLEKAQPDGKHNSPLLRSLMNFEGMIFFLQTGHSYRVKTKTKNPIFYKQGTPDGVGYCGSCRVVFFLPIFNPVGIQSILNFALRLIQIPTIPLIPKITVQVRQASLVNLTGESPVRVRGQPPARHRIPHCRRQQIQ